MCGPADFEALQTCMTRLAGLSAAAIATYAACKAVSFYRKRNLERHDQQKKTTGGLLPRFAVQGSGERSNS